MKLFNQFAIFFLFISFSAFGFSKEQQLADSASKLSEIWETKKKEVVTLHDIANAVQYSLFGGNQEEMVSRQREVLGEQYMVLVEDWWEDMHKGILNRELASTYYYQCRENRSDFSSIQKFVGKKNVEIYHNNEYKNLPLPCKRYITHAGRSKLAYQNASITHKLIKQRESGMDKLDTIYFLQTGEKREVSLFTEASNRRLDTSRTE